MEFVLVSNYAPTACGARSESKFVLEFIGLASLFIPGGVRPIVLRVSGETLT